GVEVVQRSSTTSGARCRTFEDLLHLLVVIFIQTTNLLWLFGTIQLSVHITRLCAIVRLHPQATIGHSCRLLRKRCGVCIRASNTAARIGPMHGIWRNTFTALCFRLSARNSPRTWRRKPCSPSRC